MLDAKFYGMMSLRNTIFMSLDSIISSKEDYETKLVIEL